MGVTRFGALSCAAAAVLPLATAFLVPLPIPQQNAGLSGPRAGGHRQLKVALSAEPGSDEIAKMLGASSDGAAGPDGGAGGPSGAETLKMGGGDIEYKRYMGGEKEGDDFSVPENYKASPMPTREELLSMLNPCANVSGLPLIRVVVLGCSASEATLVKWMAKQDELFTGMYCTWDESQGPFEEGILKNRWTQMCPMKESLNPDEVMGLLDFINADLVVAGESYKDNAEFLGELAAKAEESGIRYLGPELATPGAVKKLSSAVQLLQKEKEKKIQSTKAEAAEELPEAKGSALDRRIGSGKSL